MTPEAWTVIAVGVGLAGLIFRMDSHVRSQGERLAKLEGKVDTLVGLGERLVAAYTESRQKTP